MSVAVGDMVTFAIPGLHRPRVVAGRVKLLLDGGRVEVKTQGDGYWQPAVADLLTVNGEPGPANK